MLVEDKDMCYCNLCFFFFFLSDVVCVYCLFAEQVWSLFWRTVYLLSKRDRRLFFIFWSNVVCFFFISGSFFFSLQISLFKIWNYQISFRSLFSSCSFISSRSDHKFIPVYWPKFIGKAETKGNCPNLKNRSRFTEPGGQTAVRAGPCFFCIERFFTLNRPSNWTVRGFSGRTVRSGPGFKTLAKKTKINLDFILYESELLGLVLLHLFRFELFFFFFFDN